MTAEFTNIQKQIEYENKLQERKASAVEEIKQYEYSNVDVETIQKATKLEEIDAVISNLKTRYEQKQAEIRKAEQKRQQEKVIANVPEGEAKNAFNKIVAEKGLSQDEIAFWAYIINRESSWNTTATNASSGAYGLPQSLPAEKMASHGADWRTNPETQLRWMYDYMVQRYGGIRQTKAFWDTHNWY